jgi:MscS family membrane protein
MDWSMLSGTWLGNTWLQYVQFFGVVLGGVIGGKIFYWVSSKFIKVFTRKTKTMLDDILVGALERPIVFLLFVAGFWIGSRFLTLSDGTEIVFRNITSIMITMNVAWILMNILDSFILNYLTPAASKTKTDLDDALIPIVRKALKIIIVIIAIVMIIDNFGYDVTSLVAGLGLGGLAFALAAKDLLANLFGGIAILTDKPFKIGDRIRLDEKNDGFVREIGLRTTRIETLDGTQVIIPNSKIADSILENVSREQARKIKMTIGLTYETSSAKLARAKKIIQDIILKNPDTLDKSRVSFFNFSDSSLDILVIYWIKNFDNILGARDHINTEIKKRFDKEKIDIAYPTRTIHMKK